MQTQDAIENLKIGKEILESLGLTFWLSHGTCLGAYRDGNFCEGDAWDIDFAMHDVEWKNIDKIQEEFIKRGFTVRFKHEHPLGFGPEISFVRGEGHLDIFFVSPMEDGRIAWVFYTHPPQVRVIDNFFKEFGKITFFGMEFNIPSPIEEYLEANYGKNWRIPIPTKDWKWESDNKCSILYQK